MIMIFVKQYVEKESAVVKKTGMRQFDAFQSDPVNQKRTIHNILNYIIRRQNTALSTIAVARYAMNLAKLKSISVILPWIVMFAMHFDVLLAFL